MYNWMTNRFQGHRTLGSLAFLSLIAIGVTACISNIDTDPIGQKPLIPWTDPAIRESVTILDTLSGTHFFGDYYQVHVRVDDGVFTPVALQFLDQDDWNKVLKTVSFTYNPGRECFKDLQAIEYAVYETDVLTVRPPQSYILRALHKFYKRPDLPRDTLLNAFNLVVEDEIGNQFLIEKVGKSGSCYQLME